MLEEDGAVDDSLRDLLACDETCEQLRDGLEVCGIKARCASSEQIPAAIRG